MAWLSSLPPLPRAGSTNAIHAIHLYSVRLSGYDVRRERERTSQTKLSKKVVLSGIICFWGETLPNLKRWIALQLYCTVYSITELFSLFSYFSSWYPLSPHLIDINPFLDFLSFVWIWIIYIRQFFNYKKFLKGQNSKEMRLKSIFFAKYIFGRAENYIGRICSVLQNF